MLIHFVSAAKIAPHPRPVDPMRLFRLATVLLLSCSLLACTAARALTAPVTPQMVGEKLEPGDTVTITTRQGKRYRFEIVKLSDQAIHAQRGAIAWKDIALLEVREFSGGKTAGLGAGIYVGLLAVVLFAGHAMAKGFEQMFEGSDS